MCSGEPDDSLDYISPKVCLIVLELILLASVILVVRSQTMPYFTMTLVAWILGLFLLLVAFWPRVGSVFTQIGTSAYSAACLWDFLVCLSIPIMITTCKAPPPSVLAALASFCVFSFAIATYVFCHSDAVLSRVSEYRGGYKLNWLGRCVSACFPSTDNVIV